MSIKFDSREIDRIAKALDMKTAQAVNRIAYEVEGEAKQRAPVDTGALRNSGDTDAATEQEPTAIVSFGVEYAVYQEFGTSRMAAQPYFTPAIEHVQQKYNSGAAFEELVK